MAENEEKKADARKKADSPQAKESEGQRKQSTHGDYEELWDRYVRLQADFDNYRKRSFRERTEFIKFANEGLILELLGILDNFERGIKAADQKKDFTLLHQGVDMISRQLHGLLEEKGLRRIKVVGEKFDPHRHEALEVIEDEAQQSDTVVEELQPGYIFNGRIIRPAKVKVARSKQQSAAEPDKNDKAGASSDEADEEENNE